MSEWDQWQLQTVCHRPDGLEGDVDKDEFDYIVCHRPDGLEVERLAYSPFFNVCHRPDGLEVS